MKQNKIQWIAKRIITPRQCFILCLLPLFLATVLAGCKPAVKATADASPAGTYALVSVDGNPVPGTVKHEGQTLGIKSGTFEIRADGTCSSKVVFTPPKGGDAVREVKAAYTREGSKLTMKWEGAGTTTGTVEGNVFSMNNEGMVFTYQK